MKAQLALAAVALLTTVGNCLPQVLSIGPDPTSTDVLTVFGGGSGGQTITLTDGSGNLITVTVGDSGSPTGVNTQPTTSSGHGKTSTSSSPAPPTTTTSKTTSAYVSPPPPTTSTTKSTLVTTTKPPTTSTKSTTAVTTTSTAANPPSTTNPYAGACPVPSTFTITKFQSTNGAAGGASMMVTYGSGTFTCPNVANHAYYNPQSGIYQLNCDNDQLLIVETDGSSWINVQETFWCSSAPQNTLQSVSNSTSLGSVLNCQTDDGGVRSCYQQGTGFTIPVQFYNTNGVIGNAPADINGNPLPQCPRVAGQGPIVTNTAPCTGQGGTSTFSKTATGTVSVNQPTPT